VGDLLGGVAQLGLARLLSRLGPCEVGLCLWIRTQ